MFLILGAKMFLAQKGKAVVSCGIRRFVVLAPVVHLCFIGERGKNIDRSAQLEYNIKSITN
jgi:hypothetical protein